MSQHARSMVTALVAAGAISAAASSASAQSPANTPEPVAGEPSCNGLIVASFNHNSGVSGPSGNPTASAGPGPFFGPETHDAIVTLAREPNCTA
jgi:uncharacterized membrane protein